MKLFITSKLEALEKVSVCTCDCYKLLIFASHVFYTPSLFCRKLL